MLHTSTSVGKGQHAVQHPAPVLFKTRPAVVAAADVAATHSLVRISWPAGLEATAHLEVLQGQPTAHAGAALQKQESLPSCEEA